MITIRQRNDLLKEFLDYQQKTKRELSYQDYIEECLITDRIRKNQYINLINPDTKTFIEV